MHHETVTRSDRPQRQTERDSDAVLYLLFMLLAADTAIIGLDIMAWIAGIKVPALRVSTDGGLGEVFQYIKYFWMVFLAVWLTLRDRRLGFIPWVCLFAQFLADDALQVHETLGAYFSMKFSLPPALGLRGQDFGELIAAAGDAVAFGPLLIFGYALSDWTVKRIYRHWALLLAALVFFGVVIDMVHIWFLGMPLLDRAIAILEDGGEMIVASFFVASVFEKLWLGPAAPDPK